MRMIDKAAMQRFAITWLSPDNLSLASGVALITKGASLFSERAGYLTCGSLILGLTVLHLIFGRGR
jgi:hypothetical protein